MSRLHSVCAVSASALLAVTTGCSGGPGGPAPADLVLLSGVVHTMDIDLPSATAVAVADGRIVAVGSDEDVQPFVGAETVIEDLAGGAVIPGMVDAHTHLVWGGEDLQIIDLTTASSMDELLAAVAAYSEAKPDVEWVQGAGWAAPTFEGQMDKSLLDSVVPDRPVCLTSGDGHSVWVNSAALAAAGITASTADPVGGLILHDENGEPTGVLRETAAELVFELIPPFSDEENDQGLVEALELAHSHGITTVIDANFGWDVMATYLRADQAGTLNMRVHGALEVLPGLDFHQVNAIAAQRDDITSELVILDAVKFYLDGVIESGTAFLVEPYENGTNSPPLFSAAQLDMQFAAVEQAGLQIHAHAIGDGAIRQGLDAIERLNERSSAGARADLRPLFAHIELIHPIDLPRFAELGVYADFQPLWSYPDPYITDLTIPVIGDDRAAWLYPIGEMAASGATIVAGSDWNVSDINPFVAMEVAITRQDPDNPGEVLSEGQRVDIDTIMAAYTRDGARAVFGEDDIGTISVGKYADLVVLAADPWTIDAADLSDLEVESTWVAGRAVWRAE
ncbi:MAG: amidohydrolase [Myxococcales bacterium]|nr:amidohydrolase [Myxococcales bacterium]